MSSDRMRKYLIAGFGSLTILVFVAIGLVLIYGDPFTYSRDDAERDLTRAKSASEEGAIFTTIAERTRVSFYTLDFAGKRLSFSDDWTEKADVIVFDQFHPPVKHRIIERNNVGLLMFE